MWVRVLAATASIVFTIGAVAAPAAEPFEVNPVRLTISPGAKSQDLNVANQGATDITFSIRTYAWSQSPNDPLHLVDTDDVLAFPETFTVPARSSQRIRVGVTASASSTERAYRVFISQLPAAAPTTRGVHLNFVTRVGVPLFVLPMSVESSKPEIGNLSQEGSIVRVALRNDGNIHLDPSSITVSLVSADQSVVWKKTEPVWYVLAGSEHDITFSIPAAVCSRGASIRAIWTAGADRRIDRAWSPSQCGTH